MPYYVRGTGRYATKKEGGIGTVSGKRTFKINERFDTLEKAKEFKRFMRGEKVKLIHEVRGKKVSVRKSSRRPRNTLDMLSYL